MEIKVSEPQTKTSDKENHEVVPHISRFAQFYFFSMGIGSLLAWNTILTAVDYFQVSYPSHDIPFIFPIPYIIGTISVTLFMVQISQKISLNTRIIGGVISMCLVMISMCVFTATLSETTGFLVLMLLLFVLSAANIVFEASLVGISGLFPATYIRYYQSGLGVAGLCVNALRIVCLSVVGPDSSDIRSIAVYFGLVMIITVHCIVIHLKFSQSYTFTYYINKATSIKQRGESTDNIPTDPSDESSSEKKDGKTNFLNDTPSATISQIIREILPCVLLMILIFIQTFMMFPGVILKKQLSGLNSA